MRAERVVPADALKCAVELGVRQKHFFTKSIFLLIPPGKEGVISFFLLLPFILFAIIGLNLSFFSTLFGRFTLSEAKKRNHALEHGTIHFLKKLHGNNLKVGGRAEKDGFRICGVKNKKDLYKAFEQLVIEMQNRNPDFVLSLRCGSNISDSLINIDARRSAKTMHPLTQGIKKGR